MSLLSLRIPAPWPSASAFSHMFYRNRCNKSLGHHQDCVTGLLPFFSSLFQRTELAV